MPDIRAEITALAFDFGEKRIGVACGQSITGTASPLETVANHHGRPDWDQIDALVAQWQPAILVVGLPEYDDRTVPDQNQNRNNGEQAMIAASRAFAKRLRRRYQLPVEMQNEAFSSIEASRAIAANRRSQSRRSTRAGDTDKIAAAIILESWMRNRISEHNC